MALAPLTPLLFNYQMSSYVSFDVSQGGFECRKKIGSEFLHESLHRFSTAYFNYMHVLSEI